ncbi:ATP-binding protein [Sphaerisporangium corydalis]|uniref:ATP-binding protein n=1 Tax=Sphaerisporangium corydalis TaxID=1441875 RepID=A0ABV9EKZ6_9ACTN|nr:hypothetical protein [Sphaerisporangium corydalis]
MSTRTQRTETAVLPATEASVGEARRWLSKILDNHPRSDDAVLLLSEAATNSVLHTGSPHISITVTIEKNHDVLGAVRSSDLGEARWLVELGCGAF